MPKKIFYCVDFHCPAGGALGYGGGAGGRLGGRRRPGGYLRESDVGNTIGQQLLNALNALDNSEISTSKVFMSHPASPRRAIDFVVDSFDEGVLAIKWSGRGLQPLTVKDFLEQLREAGVKKISEIIWIIDADGNLEISEVGMPNNMRNIFLSMKKIADQTDYKSKFNDLLREANTNLNSQLVKIVKDML